MSTNFVYIQENDWSNISKNKRNRGGIRRSRIDGVQIKKLPESHILHDQHGLFATKSFAALDTIGEYVGSLSYKNGLYAASVDNNGLVIDAETCGNEMRFINDFHGISDEANVVMRTCYVGTYPHIIIVCSKNINEGDEIFLDYGDAYNNYYIHGLGNNSI